jgi:hypothetical protein
MAEGVGVIPPAKSLLNPAFKKMLPEIRVAASTTKQWP